MRGPVTAQKPRRHYFPHMAHAGTRPAHALDAEVHWTLAPGQQSTWPATALGSSPKAIDLDEPFAINRLALRKASLHRYALIPFAITHQHTHLHVTLNACTPICIAICTLRACRLAAMLVLAPSYYLDCSSMAA